MSGSFNLTDQTALFKTLYVKRTDNMYNSENVLQGRIKKSYEFTGKQKFVQTNLSFSGGVGSGTLPKANAGRYKGAIITAKRVYARAMIEREAIKAAKDDKGSFVRATAETIKQTVVSHMRNASRILFGDGTAVLGRGDNTNNVTGVGSESAPYVVTISEESWREFNFEEKDYVQVATNLGTYPDNTGATIESTLLEIVEVDPETREIQLVGTSAVLNGHTGNTPLGLTEGLVMQGSYENDPVGLKSVFDAAITPVGPTNKLYEIETQRRWKAQTYDANGSGITPDLLNLMMLKVKKSSGKYPTMIVTGYEQSRNIKNFLEDQKVYNLPNRNLKGAPGFAGIEFVHEGGTIGLFIDRFCDPDKVYFLNDNYISVHHRPDFGWFDDDGTVFLRMSDEDAYEARYGGYYQNFITPTFHGFIHNLAVE